MRGKRKYKIIAAFLLTVFSLNTVIGFACSVGLDMGYNSKHHHDEPATEPVVHIHKDGKKHVHNEKKYHNHSHSNSLQHTQANDHPPGENKDDCCGDEVTKFGQLDKSIPNSLHIIHPIFITAFFGAFYNVALPSLDIAKNIKQFVRSYHPPIPDIRITIQSFQI